MVATSRMRPHGPTGPRRVDLATLAALTVTLRIPAFVADRHLTFDDGVYGASAVAMRAGAQPFRDVFSSQGPLFLPLLYLADWLGLRSTNAPRLLSMAAGIALVSVTYVAGREITDRLGAVVAATLVSVTASVLWVTGPIAADGVALALATATVLATLRWRDAITTRRAVWLGLGVGATISVKALLAPVVVPVALVLLARRRLLPVVAGAMAAIVSHLLLWLPWGPANVWDQSYGYHLEVDTQRTPGANLAKVLSTLGDRDLLVVAAVLMMAGAIVLQRRAVPPGAEPRWTSPDTLLLGWLGATVLVLAAEHPFWRPHVSQLIPPLVLLAARHRPPARALAVAAVLVLPYHVGHAWGVLHPAPYSAGSQRVISLLRALPAGALAMSDDPGVVWRAGRLTPPDLVDTSVLRIESGDLTAASIVEAATDPRVCAVVVRSRTRWGSFDDLGERLAAAGFVVVFDDPRGGRLYRATDCQPG
jgi:4-amino-4-deoxy-L-arabinose transferase-like glycosyltransferase